MKELLYIPLSEIALTHIQDSIITTTWIQTTCMFVYQEIYQLHHR